MKTAITLTVLFGLMAAEAVAQPNVSEMRAVEAPAEAAAISLGTGGVAGMPPESWVSERGARSVRNVSRATLTPVLPTPDKATGAAVIVAPGGAFYGLAMDVEGWRVAQALADRGIAAFVLKYRLRSTPAGMEDFQAFIAENIRRSRQGTLDLSIPPQSLDDARAALRLVRSRAPEWKVDPKRIGMLGFSAGAKLTVGVALASDRAETPAFIAPIYGPMNAVAVPAAAPPMFAALAADDPLVGRQGYGLIEAWHKAGRPVELHVYQSGGHGYGIGRPGTTTVGWIDSFVRWLQVNGVVPPAP